MHFAECFGYSLFCLAKSDQSLQCRLATAVNKICQIGKMCFLYSC